MAESFAGSRSLDERRRRRLAGESTVATDYTPVAAVTPNNARPESQRQPETRQFDNQTDFPLARLISARKWKLVSSVVLLVATTVGVVVFGQSKVVRTGEYGDTISRVFMLPHGTFFKHCSALMLIATAQLAFSIGWVRSRNPRDFGGYYRIWRLAAGMLFVAAVCVATGLHHGLAELVAFYLPRNYPYRDTFNWLVPISVVAFPITVKVIHDMSNCRLSTWLFSFTAIAAVAVAVAPMIDQWNADETTLAIAQVAVCCSLLCSMLIHTWFVLHVSSEPPGQSSDRKNSRKAAKAKRVAITDDFDLLEDLPELKAAPSTLQQATETDCPIESPSPSPSTPESKEPKSSEPKPTTSATKDPESGKSLRLDGSHPTGETGRRARKSRPKSKRKSRKRAS